MNKYIKYFLLTLAAIAAFVSCRRDALVFPKLGVIELNIDWSRSSVNANSATAIIYRDGVYHSTEIFSAYPPITKHISLPSGTYDIVVHNDQALDFDKSLYFNGMESLNTLEVNPMDDPENRATTHKLKVSADTMAIDKIEGIVITESMIVAAANSASASGTKAGPTNVIKKIDFTPKQVFTAVSIKVNITNAHGYYFTKNNPPSLFGTSAAYIICQDAYSSNPVGHALTLAPLTQNQANSTVTYQGDILAIGLAGRVVDAGGQISFDGDYTLNLPFTSNNGLEVKAIDLKNEAKVLRFTPEDPNDPTNNIDHLEIEVDVTLPILIPIGDIEVGMEDWTDVDIPLDGPQRLYFVANNGSDESYFQTNIAGVVINLPLPTVFTPVAGLQFLNWNTKADGKGDSHTAGTPYMMQRGSTIFYAIWKKT